MTGPAKAAPPAKRPVETRRALIVVALALLFGGLVLAMPIHGLAAWPHRVLAIVAIALVLWIGEGLDIAVTSMAVIVLLAIFGPGESSAATRAALYGFQLSAGYFVLCTLVVATATVKCGLAARIARLLIAGARGSARRMYLELILFMPPFAMVVPSATTRNAILIPAYEHVYDRYGVKRGDRLSRVNSLAMGVLQMVASTAVLTGGVVPITSAFLLGGMSWGQWFKYMAVPCYAVIFGAAALLYLWNRPKLPAQKSPIDVESEPVSNGWTGPEIRTAITIGVMTLLWLGDFVTGWDPLIPAILGAVVLLTPGIGVLTWREFENASPWRLFFVTGSALSIARAMETSGAASWMANTLLGHVPLAGLPVMLLLPTLLLVVVPVSIMLPNRSGALGILIPLLSSISVRIGVNPIPVGLMATLTVQTTTFYPVQNAATLLVYQTRHFALFDLLRAGLIVFAVSLLVMFTIAFPWWGLVGIPLRP